MPYFHVNVFHSSTKTFVVRATDSREAQQTAVAAACAADEKLAGDDAAIVDTSENNATDVTTATENEWFEAHKKKGSS